MTTNRRQFLQLLGTGTVAGVGLAQPATAQETPTVDMGNNYFDPIGLHVEPGTTVRFVIEAGAHSATAYPDRIPVGATAFDSGTFADGSFEHTFETPGTYDYYCIPHKSVGMVGRIVVGSPGGPADDSSIPDGTVPGADSIVEQGLVSYEEFADGDGDSSGGMMGPGMGPGMGSGPGGGWVGSLPFAGGALAAFGILGALLYWAIGRTSHESANEDGALATLRERYARGELDEEEYRRRRERLETEAETGSR